MLCLKLLNDDRYCISSLTYMESDCSILCDLYRFVHYDRIYTLHSRMSGFKGGNPVTNIHHKEYCFGSAESRSGCAIHKANASDGGSFLA